MNNKNQLAQTIYAWTTRCLLPLASLYLTYRARKQPEYSEHWDERFGWKSFPTPKEGVPRLWLHAVSLGETVASKPLIDMFLAKYSDAQILLTAMTPTGREAGAKIAKAWPDRIVQCYLPYDTPELMGKFFDQTRPVMGVVMETEVWPNLMLEAGKRGIPVVLANARESEKSARIAERFIGVMRPAFSAFRAVLAQSEDDAARFKRLGAGNVTVCGSMKFDLKADSDLVEKARNWKETQGRSVVLLASTRDTEEEMFLESIQNAPKDVLVVLVPRHPQRFNDVAQLFMDKGIETVRKSQNPELTEVSPSTRVILGDTLGEMSFYCALADVCLMGGSYGGFGCQNLIEPAAAGAPVVLGPSTFNFSKPAEDAVEMGAACRVETAAEGFAKALEWLADGRLQERSAKAKAFAGRYTGATKKQMRVIDDIWQEENRNE